MSILKKKKEYIRIMKIFLCTANKSMNEAESCSKAVCCFIAFCAVILLVVLINKEITKKRGGLCDTPVSGQRARMRRMLTGFGLWWSTTSANLNSCWQSSASSHLTSPNPGCTLAENTTRDKEN